MDNMELMKNLYGDVKDVDLGARLEDVDLFIHPIRLEDCATYPTILDCGKSFIVKNEIGKNRFVAIIINPSAENVEYNFLCSPGYSKSNVAESSVLLFQKGNWSGLGCVAGFPVWNNQSDVPERFVFKTLGDIRHFFSLTEEEQDEFLSIKKDNVAEEAQIFEGVDPAERKKITDKLLESVRKSEAIRFITDPGTVDYKIVSPNVLIVKCELEDKIFCLHITHDGNEFTCKPYVGGKTTEQDWDILSKPFVFKKGSEMFGSTMLRNGISNDLFSVSWNFIEYKIVDVVIYPSLVQMMMKVFKAFDVSVEKQIEGMPNRHQALIQMNSGIKSAFKRYRRSLARKETASNIYTEEIHKLFSVGKENSKKAGEMDVF